MERLTYKGANILQACNMPCDGYCSSCYYMDKAIEKLKAYEDAEEQGLLLRLPCKPEDKLYWISDEDEEFDYEPIEEVEVAEFSYNGYSLQIWFADTHDKEYPILPSVAIGNELFLTREEAEQKLAEMKGEA